MTAADNSLDFILNQVGDFGKYQMFMFSFVCIAVIFHSAVHVAYVFTAMNLDYRCDIPECDDPINPEYDTLWLANAIPYSENEPLKCTRFSRKNASIASNCSDSDFTAHTELCDNFVYKTDENTILKEYNLQCDDNLWKLTLVGTMNNIGQFFGLFISGIISDRFGRKIVLIFGLVFCGICGIIRSFAPTYEWFLFFEFLDAAFGAGSYVCGFIMGVELVGPKKRVLTGTIASSCYAVGEVFAAGAAWLVKSWKPIIYILYVPPICVLGFFWIIPESVRWNLSKGRTEEAKATLRQLAKVNGKEITESSFDKLVLAECNESITDTYVDVLKTTTLFLRLINCCFCWITCAFLFYGLTLNSVALAGNPYLDFILTSLVEIPAYFVCNYIIDKFGRKWSLSGSFFLTGLSCLAFIVIPDGSDEGRLAVYLIGKFGATAAFTVTYVITSELFPTPLRHSMMGTCSTFGRIGSMVAPQTPLLAQIWNPLPIIMFSVMATIASLLTILFPETLRIKLPDTIEEAVNIGKIQKTSPTES